MPLCTEVRRACFDGEQIFLHGEAAQQHKEAIDKILAKAADLYTAFKKLHAHERSITHVSLPAAEFSFLPLAINAISALSNQSSGIFQTRSQPQSAAEFSSSTAVAFVTTWSQSFGEAFSRAGTQLFEEFCSHSGDIVPIPAAWGLAEQDSADTYVAPLGRNGSWPMSLKPATRTLDALDRADVTAICGNEPCIQDYIKASEAFYQAKGQVCFEKAHVCNFQHPPNVHSMRPWSFMQAVAAQHSGRPPWWATGPIPTLRACHSMTMAKRCPLQVVIIQREGRRRLHHIDELVAACNAWRPRQPQITVECTAHSFGNGLVASLPLLRRTDLLIGSHGADMINALAMHAGASVVEVMPPILRGCPCSIYQSLFSATAEAGRILPYTASTHNRSYAVPWNEPKYSGTYNSDILLPTSVITQILERVVQVDGQLQLYRRVASNFTWS